MIVGVKGTLEAVESSGDAGAEVAVDVDGVTYGLVVGARQAANLPPVGAHVELAVYTHVREGAITLYGFADRDERRLFSILITAHGVGPALGVAILGTFAPAALVRAVTGGDVDALTAVPGVGKKTAQRLVIELGERFGNVDVALAASSGRGAADFELREALVSLGFGPDEVHAALERIPSEGSVEMRLRLALQAMAPIGAGR